MNVWEAGCEGENMEIRRTERKAMCERWNDEILSTIVASARLHAGEDIGNGN